MQDIGDLLKKNKKNGFSQNGTQNDLNEKLSDMEIKNQEAKIKQKARNNNLPYIDLSKFPISPEALRLIPRASAKQNKLICFFRKGDEVRLASPQAFLAEVQEQAKKIAQEKNLKIGLYLISQRNFKKALKRYEALPKIREQRKQISISAKDFKNFQQQVDTFQELSGEIKNVSTSKLLTFVMASATSAGASDVHFEAEENAVQLRFRIDGVLVDVAKISKDRWGYIASRIKLLSGMKLNVSDIPQDGHFVIKLPEERIDIRASALPTAYGESLVMRLLRSSSLGISFENLGIGSYALDKLKKEISRPNGMILTTGPTGSGKTTTLYAILKKLNDAETKIITLENPIEYRLEGINQSQVDKSKDYDFAKGLKSILRQDPDVVMVGEIRDLETATTSLQAALTGHVVVSTLHTNDAAGALPRLFSLGVKPYLLGPAINAVIGQRLVRRVCKHCKKEVKIEGEQLKKIKKILSGLPDRAKKEIDLEDLHFYKGQGCKKCQNLGYKGRIGIYEIFNIDQGIEKYISGGGLSKKEVEELTQKQGMVKMVQDGLIKASKGLTSVEEVFRVIE
ncbi:MAG TPA: GspE/PulE family protein [Patescibacteria group bacterium]|nr:GspE/PulE family protein [Patescibacteria group bacterium]